MPIDLVLVRHGESEQNLASRMKNTGVDLYTPEFRARHVSQHRLTSKGCEQAKVTGQWLKQNNLGHFDARFVTEYVRGRETAGLLNIDGTPWKQDPNLREREWGNLDTLSWEERQDQATQALRFRDTDPFYWIPPNGESMAQLTRRLLPFFDTLHRECFDKRVIVVCHGEVMWALRTMIERMSVDRWMKLLATPKPGDRIFNCQILHYSRRNPETGQLANHLDWLRSVCPATPSNSSPSWEKIIRPRYTNEELLASVNTVQPLFDPEQHNS